MTDLCFCTFIFDLIQKELGRFPGRLERRCHKPVRMVSKYHDMARGEALRKKLSKPFYTCVMVRGKEALQGFCQRPLCSRRSSSPGLLRMSPKPMDGNDAVELNVSEV